MSTAQPASRLRRNLWITAAGLVLFTVMGFFILPPIVKSQLEKRLSAELGRAVTVGRVRLNPYALSLTLEDFDIRLKAGTGSFMGWKRLYVNFDALSSLGGDWVLSEVDLDQFHVGVIIQADGSLNFSDLLERLAALTPPPGAAPAKPSRAVRIGSLKVGQARVEFGDVSRKRPFGTVLGPVSFNATELRTAGSRGAPSHFEAVTEAGEKLAWTGTVSAEPFRSVGELVVENIQLPKYAPYYADMMRTDVMQGRLTLRGRYDVNLTEGQRVIKLSQGAAELRGLKLNERATGAPVAEFPVLDLRGISSDALLQSSTIESVRVTGGHLLVRRNADGTINLLKMLESELSTTVQAKLPEIAIGEISVGDFQLAVSDLAAPRPARLDLDHVQLSLKNFTLAAGAIMPLQLAFDWRPQGRVQVGGTVILQPELSADLKADVAAFAILPFSPYLEQFVNARITQGTLSTVSAVQVEMKAGAPVIQLAGDVQVGKFGLVDGARNEDLAGFESLTLTGLKVSTATPLTVSLTEARVTAPYARVVVNADKTLNLLAVIKTTGASETVGGALRPDSSDPTGLKAPPTADPTNAASQAAEPKIEIDRVVIAGGDFSYADRSVEPNVRMAISQFGGTLIGLSSAHLARADVDLKASVDGSGPIRITGKLDPFGATKHVDLKLDFRNVDLLGLSPYTGKYAGYELARGKLALDVHVQLDGRKVEATNLITLNQFTFGAPVQSPDATSLPVRLGVALLKDMNGVIVIDAPVSGSLDDPSFRISKMVWRVIVNLLTKAAVSPFALLGSMFGGGGDELAYQEFAPGAAALQPAEIKKLDTMVKALANRPGLSLDLEGSYDGPADTYALRQLKLAGTVRRALWEAKHAVDPNVPPPDQLVLTAEEEAGMVKKLFDEKFPPGTQFGAPLAAAPVVAAPPPPAKKGFFARVVDVFTFNGSGHNAAPAAEKAAAPDAAAAAVATGPSLVEMSGRLAETMVVTDNDLRALAQQRAQQVRDYFITTGKIDPERLFLAKDQADPANRALAQQRAQQVRDYFITTGKIDPERLFLAKDQTDPAKAGKGPRVFLTLQ